jgi:hypothetical protein
MIFSSEIHIEFPVQSLCQRFRVFLIILNGRYFLLFRCKDANKAIK